MTSAAMVHAITRACSDGRLRNCSCDNRLQGQTTQQGWQWGGCSDDVEFGIMFTRSFLDARETENIANKTSKQLSQSLVNLHNNQVGRTVSLINHVLICTQCIINCITFDCIYYRLYQTICKQSVVAMELQAHVLLEHVIVIYPHFDRLAHT